MDHDYTPGCPCPGCTMHWATSDPDAYSRWLRQESARSLSATPGGPGRRTVMRNMAEYRTLVPAASTAPATRTRTPLSEVRRMVARKKAEMRADEIERRYRGTPGQRRLANEAARNFRDAVATPPPRPYDQAAAERRRLDELREALR